MRMTGQQKWAAACGVQMFIIGVFGTPHRSFAQIAPGPTVTAAMRNPLEAGVHSTPGRLELDSDSDHCHGQRSRFRT